MQVVILAAGRGTRMGPLTESIPKPMLPVADRPLIAHVMDAAVSAGADEFIVIVGYNGDRIREHLGDERAGIRIRYVEQHRQLGTADALATAAELLEGSFAVLNGDSLYRPADLRRLFESVPQVGAYRVYNPSEYGVLVTQDGVVTEVREKPDDPPGNLVNAGAYVFPENAIDLVDVPMSERGERELTDVLERVIERSDLEYVTLEEWMDVGRPWELLEANERLLPTGDTRPAPDRSADVHPTATIRGDVVCEPDASIGAGVVIDGPVLIQSGASIGPNAYVRGATLIGPNAHVGHAVEIKNSVVMADANVGHLSYVGDSVIGPRVNLGAGTNVANLRHDGKSVTLDVKGERTATGRRKFGVVLGPDVKTGIQTGINAGVTLSTGTQTEPGEIVTRDR